MYKIYKKLISINYSRSLFLFIYFLFAQTVFPDANTNLSIPVDLSKLDWYAKKGFNPKDISPNEYNEKDYQKISQFPIILNSIYNIPFSSNSINEFTLICKFPLNLDRIDKGKELAFLFPGIGETWAVFLNGELIKDEFGIKNNHITKYKMVRNAIITIPYGLLAEENYLTIRIAGYAPTSFLSPNILFGLRFKEGYILDYEKKLQESISQTTVLLFNAVYIFFGLYHLFFFIRWTEKKYNLYFGVFSVSISGYFLAFSNIAFQSVDDTRILVFLGYLSQPLALLSFILFLFDYFYPSRRFSFFIKYSIASNLFIILAFIIFNINYYLSFLYLWYILIISQIFYIFYFIINSTRMGLKDAVPMASSILIILLVIIWEILDTILFQTGLKLLQFAYFTFIISMVIILANRFIEINWETRRLNIELTHQRDSFSKFVPSQFLDLLGKNSASDISLGECKLQEMTILFADIREFTSLSESMTPEQNFKFINSYLKQMSPVIEKHNGFIDKFIGDAIMAIFPLPDEGLKAAIEMINELEVLNEGRKRANYRPLSIGIGLNTGMLMMGTIGHEDRLSTTVIGDTVNVAARLETLTKLYSVPILVSEFLVSKLKNVNDFSLREVDSVVVKGKTQTIKIHECFQNDPENIKANKNNSKIELSEAISIFNSGGYNMALNKFISIQSEVKGDAILDFHITRCKKVIKENRKINI